MGKPDFRVDRHRWCSIPKAVLAIRLPGPRGVAHEPNEEPVQKRFWQQQRILGPGRIYPEGFEPPSNRAFAEAPLPDVRGPPKSRRHQTTRAQD